VLRPEFYRTYSTPCGGDEYYKVLYQVSIYGVPEASYQQDV